MTHSLKTNLMNSSKTSFELFSFSFLTVFSQHCPKFPVQSSIPCISILESWLKFPSISFHRPANTSLRAKRPGTAKNKKKVNLVIDLVCIT